MKKIAVTIVIFSLVCGLAAQTPPRIRDLGENFTYAALECLGPYEQIPAKLGELMAEADKQKLEPLDGPCLIYYNSPGQLKAEELRWDVCLPVGAQDKVAPPLKKGEYRHTTVAEVIYKGPYAGVSAAYPPLMQFIAQSGYAVCGPICESYLDDPSDTRPEECRTLIVVPVKK